MSLILKQEPANTIATPPAGKSTLFVNDNSVMSVKSPDGNVTQFPTVQGSNTQVFFNDSGAINGNANLTFDKTTSTMSVVNLSVTGNLNAGDINVSSIANGTSNVDIIGTGGNVTTSVNGASNVLVVTSTGAIVTGIFSSTGNATVGNLITGGLITATGNINGANLITGGLLSATGNLTAGNISTGGLLSVIGNANVGNLGTATLVATTGNIDTLNTSLMQNGDSNVQIYPNAAIAISVDGNANVVFVSPTGMAVTGSISATTTLSATGNANVGNLGTTGVFATTLSASGNANTGNLGTTGVFATTLSASGNANIGNIGTGGLITATGNLNAGNIITAGIVSATGNITGQFFIGNGSQLTGIDATSIQNGNSNVKVYANSAVTTSVAGVANVLLVSATGLEITGLTSSTGNATAGNLITGGVVTATGNVTGANVITAGSVFAPAIVANSGAYDTRVTLDTSSGTIEANSTGNATQFLPSGQVRLGGAATIMSGTSDGSELVLATTQTNLNQLRGGDVTLQVGTSGTPVSTLRLQNSGNLVAPAAVSAAGNITGGNIITGGVVTSTGNVTGGNLTTAGTVSGGIFSATGNIVSGANVVTDLIIGKTTNVTITAAGSNQNINLVPTGTGTVNVGTFRISNVATPTQTTDAATKQYVDSLAASGIHYHDPVFVESPDTAGNLNATYNNGTSGVGATLTNAGTQAALTIDGVLMTVGKRVLIYNQTNQFENGVYTVTTVGDGSTNWVLTRATDADSYGPYSPDTLGQGDAFFVTNGNTGAGETYICNTVGTITFGTTAITFAQISDATLYTAGTGLSLNGTAFSISNTAVTTGTYGGADVVSTIAVNQQGQITSASNTVIQANAANLAGTTLKSSVVSSSLTAVGTLSLLSVSGNANVGNLNSTGAVTASTVVAGILTSNVSTGTAPLTVTSTTQVANLNVATAGTAGTVTTAAQPNITSVGTLSTLSVSGNANVGNIGGGSGIYTTLSASGNVTGGNLVSTGTIGGTGATHLGSTLSTGANTTAGTVTGNFTLSTGSRFAATYS